MRGTNFRIDVQRISKPLIRPSATFSPKGRRDISKRFGCGEPALGFRVNPHDELQKLTHLFPSDQDLIAKAEHVASALVPEPYQRLLVHNSHMTVTMEEYHHSRVDVKILARAEQGEIYSRKIILLKSGTDEVVQFGIVRFDFQYVTSAVRQEILDGQIPLGRVLINHNVLRHIDLGAVLRITPGPELAKIFRTTTGTITYGRLATIFCNQQPAVDLLEISVPLD